MGISDFIKNITSLKKIIAGGQTTVDPQIATIDIQKV
jgi:hypothetical protein